MLPAWLDTITQIVRWKQNTFSIATDDYYIKCFNYIDCTTQYIAHNQHINCMVGMDDNIFISSSEDKTVKIWDNRVVKNCISSYRDICVLTTNTFISYSFEEMSIMDIRFLKN